MKVQSPALDEQRAGAVRTLQRVREDALPEHTEYRDTGCDIHPSCLSCPLPRCRYDEPGGIRALLGARRDRQIVALRRQGLTIEELSRRFGVSRRTVFRALEKARAQDRPEEEP
ncbi:MAG: helix-turn-helix domain-containing protein [Dehalococcoidia bacterium]|jgi:AraC-like DNA-binding protein|nr:helix-turn-helix domain-containing protein [Dehalococcoidia bacterium]MDW8009805.1 helix-turn-helix domain-containing protein [Chloroflexota bacterium]